MNSSDQLVDEIRNQIDLLEQQKRRNEATQKTEFRIAQILFNLRNVPLKSRRTEYNQYKQQLQRILLKFPTQTYILEQFIEQFRHESSSSKTGHNPLQLQIATLIQEIKQNKKISKQNRKQFEELIKRYNKIIEDKVTRANPEFLEHEAKQKREIMELLPLLVEFRTCDPTTKPKKDYERLRDKIVSVLIAADKKFPNHPALNRLHKIYTKILSAHTIKLNPELAILRENKRKKYSPRRNIK